MSRLVLTVGAKLGGVKEKILVVSKFLHCILGQSMLVAVRVNL